MPSVLGAGVAVNPTGGTDVDDMGYILESNTGLGGWASSFSNKYVGFKDDSGNNGYLKVSWNISTFTLSYDGGAIENAGGAISTPGSVPEPGTLALLAAGAVGLARRRRALRLAA